MYYNTMYRNIPLVIIRSSHVNSIAVSLFVDWLTLTITESEANPNSSRLVLAHVVHALQYNTSQTHLKDTPNWIYEAHITFTA